MPQCLLVIVTTPSLEESMADWLLVKDGLSGFSSMRIDGHGSRLSDLSLAEQVLGRQRKLMFHVHAECIALSALIEELRRDFRGTGLHYWLMPLLDAGVIE